MRKKYVLITPTYNEELNIEKTINSVFANFPDPKKNDFHVLVVDGNSPDKTSDIVRNLIKKHKNLHLIVEKNKGGLGAAYLYGMDYAFNKMKADYVFEFDADLSHDPAKIPQFVREVENGADLVLGTRYKKGGGIPKNWGLHRKVLSVGGNLFIRVMFLSKKITDWTGGYKCVSKEVYKAVKNRVSLQKGYTFQISLNKEALNQGFKIAEVPFMFKDREKGKSKLGPEYLFNAFLFVVTTQVKSFLTSSFFKVCLVGTVGAFVQILSLHFLSEFFIIPVAHNVSILLAITSNFLLNNSFSFRSQKITGFWNILKKYPGFVFVSTGSIIIQNVVMTVGLMVLSTSPTNVQILNVIGILIGLIFNYTMYTKLIWRKKG